MSDSLIWCVICLPYLGKEVKISITESCSVALLQHKLAMSFQSEPPAYYLYDAEHACFLDPQATIGDLHLAQGTVLYWI